MAPNQERLFPDKIEGQHRVAKIVSGGQTGVDRGALDAAIELGIEHGGWCPRGRLAEDGTIPEKYELQESDSRQYAVRTELNVIDSDGTLIVYDRELSGGTELTYRLSRKHSRSCMTVDLSSQPDVNGVCQWLIKNRIETLNVAGPRESGVPGIHERSKAFVVGMLKTQPN